MNTFLREGVVHTLYHIALLRLFGVDDGFVNGIPASGSNTPVVGGVLIAIDSDFSSLNFFVSIYTHDTNIINLFNCLIYCA